MAGPARACQIYGVATSLEPIAAHDDGERQANGFPVSGSPELRGLALMESRCRPSEPFRRVSERPCFRLLLAGSYRELSRNQSALYEPVTLVYEPTGLDYRAEAGENGAHFFTIELAEPWLNRVCGIDTLVADLHGGDLLWLALHVYREYTSLPNPFAAIAIEGLVMQILATLARIRWRARQGSPPPWLQRVLARLHSGLSEDDSLKDLAALAHVHPVHLSRGFRRFTGTTFGEYVQRLRVHAACRELLHADATLAAIAINAGFADQSHLTNVFRHITGFTPAVLRDLLPSFADPGSALHPRAIRFHPIPGPLHPTSPMLTFGSG